MLNQKKYNNIEIDTKNTIFPMKFIEDLYKIFISFNVQTVTPDDLVFLITDEILNSETIDNIYQREYVLWKNCAPKNRITALLLHDCDSAPNNMINILEYEKSLSIKSTNSIYVTTFATNEEKAFPIDYEKLVQLQQHGFCFTYHWNHTGNDKFDPLRYWEFFDSDVEFLRSKGLTINYYSSHGGKKSKEGKYNYEYFCPEKANNKLLSTHNRYGIMGHWYSDGGFLNRPVETDIRNYLMSMLNGERYTMLLHPCYYGARDDTHAKQFFATHPFVKEYWDYFHSGNTAPYWKNVIKAFCQKKTMM